MTVEEVLADSRIRALLLDKYQRGTSAQYKLRTTRLGEYIRGRNRRIKDDLLCACMYGALVHNSPSASESARSRILALVVNLQERLARVERFLEEKELEETTAQLLAYPAAIPQERVIEIVNTALLRGLAETQIIEFLADRFEHTPFGLKETERGRIKNKIDAKMKERFKSGIIRESSALKESVMNVLEKKARPSRSDYMRCAARAYKKALSLGQRNGQRILETFFVDVRRLIVRRSIDLIDSAMDETLRTAGLGAR